MPATTIPKKNLHGIPQAITMPKKIAMKTSDVPRSGCFKTKMNGIPTYAAIGNRS